MRTLLLGVLPAAALAGCAVSAGVKEFRAPNGTVVKTAKCLSDSGKCFAMAASSCPDGGTYRVISSESHSGGFGMDVMPG